MLVSNFELLLKRITPSAGNIANSDRPILQGYFLTIANTSETDLNLRLQFTATTPSLNVMDTFVIADVTGGNAFGDLTPTSNSKRFTYNVQVPGCDTALIILQPDIRKLNVDSDTLEIRGFVEIFLESPFFDTYNLLLNPEHRGTFLPNTDVSDFDQLVYTLPTPNGGSLFSVGPAIPDNFPVQPEQQQLQENLSFMAQRMDSLQERLANLEASNYSEEGSTTGNNIMNRNS